MATMPAPGAWPSAVVAAKLLPMNWKVWPGPTKGSNRPSAGDGVKACTTVVPPTPWKRPAPEDSRLTVDSPVVISVPRLSRSLCRSANVALTTLNVLYSSTRPVAVSEPTILLPLTLPR